MCSSDLDETAVMDAAIQERVYFTLKDGHQIEEYTFKLTTKAANGAESTSEVQVEYHPSKDRYYVTIPDIPAAYLDHVYKIEVIHNETGEVYEVYTSVMRWVVKTLESTTTTQAQKNLAKALYYYNQAANVHFNR